MWFRRWGVGKPGQLQPLVTPSVPNLKELYECIYMHAHVYMQATKLWSTMGCGKSLALETMCTLECSQSGKYCVNVYVRTHTCVCVCS